MKSVPGIVRTILIVEDDELVRKSLVTFLSSLGFMTLAVSSAEEALSLNGLEGVDLCFLDYQLPGMNGIELTHALRERSLNMPVLMMTGYVNEQVREEARDAGIVTFLHKPTDMAVLGEKLDELASSIDNT